MHVCVFAVDHVCACVCVYLCGHLHTLSVLYSLSVCACDHEMCVRVFG